jgi:uncharacterized paraquat-inducible protein A
MKTINILMMAALTILFVPALAQDTITQKVKTGETGKIRYACPMHPDMVMDEPGKCPRCGAELNLSPKEQMKMEVVKLYTCPAHPDVARDKPGKCPECKRVLNLS